jgi:hypothetical protein
MTFLNPRKVCLNNFILNLAYNILNVPLRYVKTFLNFPDAASASVSSPANPRFPGHRRDLGVVEL